MPHTVEEAYEVADAALAGDPAKLADELGDLIFQVYFLALLLEEQGYGGLEEVARSVHAKLVRRHPHVFESAGELRSPGEVKARWEDLKRDQEGRSEIFHHVPKALSSLLLAGKVQRRAATVGYDYPDLQGPLDHLRAEIAELSVEIDRAGAPRPETEPDAHVFDEIGDVLFTVVNVARRLNVDPELALRQTTQKFVNRIERARQRAAESGETWEELGLEAQDHYYDLAKEALG